MMAKLWSEQWSRDKMVACISSFVIVKLHDLSDLSMFIALDPKCI
jgi:hypothetical protein